MHRRLLMILVVVVSSWAPGPVRAADPGTASARTEGTILVVVGSVIQAGALAFTALEMADQDLEFFGPRVVLHGISVPFAPITLRGYELALTGGTDHRRCRALSIGFLQGAAYSGAITLLTGIRSAMLSKRGQYGEEIVIYIDFVPILIPHFSISIIFLTIGLFLSAETCTGDLAQRAPVQVLPWGSHRAQGLAIVGRF